MKRDMLAATTNSVNEVHVYNLKKSYPCINDNRKISTTHLLNTYGISGWYVMVRWVKFQKHITYEKW